MALLVSLEERGREEFGGRKVGNEIVKFFTILERFYRE
jgi:hypothetical protein